MNKIVKFVVLPLTALIVIVVAIGAYVAATFDPNQYKGQIVQAVKDKTKRTLKLDGDIKLSLFPSIGAKLGKSSLSEYAQRKGVCRTRGFAGLAETHAAAVERGGNRRDRNPQSARYRGSRQGRQAEHRRPDGRRQNQAGSEERGVAGQNRHRPRDAGKRGCHLCRSGGGHQIRVVQIESENGSHREGRAGQDRPRGYGAKRQAEAQPRRRAQDHAYIRSRQAALRARRIGFQRERDGGGHHQSGRVRQGRRRCEAGDQRTRGVQARSGRNRQTRRQRRSQREVRRAQAQCD